MNKLTCVESYIDQDQNHYGCFLIEPLEIGQGITLGNALRRTLLSDLSGFAITGVRVNNLKHVDKDSREHFEVRISKRFIDIVTDSPSILDLLLKTELPSGVSCSLKVLDSISA